MKIIISHDVDHLYATDHIWKDLILEKLWIKSLIYMFQGKISLKTFFCRLTMLFHNRMHRIDEIMEFDKKHQIPSIFFFGMDNVLGMSYSKRKAEPIIKKVARNGFDVGVHGVAYTDINQMKIEHDSFLKLSGMTYFGIRNHYVRFNKNTFEKMADVGYLFDSTEFNKIELEYKAPYKVKNMWEFPLHIMDGYICFPGRLEEGLVNTFNAIKEAERQGMPYCTILFHDYQFDDNTYPDMKVWYEKVVEFCEKNNYQFFSYRDAIKELERA